jgi:hypothetical protein
MQPKKHKPNQNKKSLSVKPQISKEPIDLIKNTPISELPAEKKTEITNELNSLSNNISEYLTSYLLIGHNMEGIPITLIIAKQQKDLDALNYALHRFILLQASKPSTPENNATPD